MDDKICRNFFAIRNTISDKLDKNGNYQLIIENNLKGYCGGNRCANDLEKINAGCLYLFDAFFESSSVFNSVANGNINIVDYIIIWLSYMLNLKPQVGKTSNLQYFYNTYVKGGDMYKKSIANVMEYSNYKNLIDKKNDLINMDIKDISKLYDVFSRLCNMYVEINEENPKCEDYLKKANEFVERYKKLIGDSNITKNSSCRQILVNLSNDYDNFKKKCNDIKCSNSSSFPTIEKTTNFAESIEQKSGQISTHISEVESSSSSITSKLFIVLSIFGAIAFFLGISYKYSLFGFRKRAQKQYIREKIKNIKKRMNQ
ncbi:PIR protein [Plasmodium yoelii]|uniref:PIR protein n=2 Tax=Plasmodium yoelii TaxID=5861 RepID=A0AAE9WKK5_PLAYO|nr:PIR protein [Plasmodium yoelii]WBY54666.1 PIR protein [Plasmodium yoelii yoelii]CDU16034.1 YIR protein [Plasmodium yoelii]VTZ71658.1 PIR protein [Plasmodium yoelii]|eukprot:XP_022811325.1 PIR protein [Plasmodium yoelii]